MRWNSDTSLTSNGHALNTNVPSLDDFTAAKLELERLSFSVGYIYVRREVVDLEVENLQSKTFPSFLSNLPM